MEIEGKQREVLDSAGLASRDQLDSEARDLAQTVSAYYRELRSGGVDMDTCMWLCRDQADYLRDYGDC